MKKNIALLFCLLTLSQNVFAAGVGFVDYTYIYKNAASAKKFSAQMDAKVQEIRKYNLETVKIMKTKKTTEERIIVKNDRQANLVKLEKDYIGIKKQFDETMKAKVKVAADKVMAQKQLDIIVDKRYTVTGGIDCTQEVFKLIK